MNQGRHDNSTQVHSLAFFSFSGDLAELLVRGYRETPICYRFRGHPAVKDSIEAMGVPHTEVDVITANGRSVDFDYHLQHQDTLHVYPAFYPLELENRINLTRHPPAPVTFVLDVHLGKLARYLRLLGFDCSYQNDMDDAAIVQLSGLAQRVVLTRDKGLLKRRQVVFGCLIRSNQVESQVHEVLDRFQLRQAIRPFCRCVVCNHLIVPVEKAEILHRLKPKTRRYYNIFQRCPGCNRIYWQGPHYVKICQWLDNLLRG